MPNDIIARGQSRPAIVDESNERYFEAWSVVANSPISARQKLATIGVYIGAPYRSIYGETPDSTIVCRVMTIEDRPPAPVGGSGDYLIECEFSRPENNRPPDPDPPDPPDDDDDPDDPDGPDDPDDPDGPGGGGAGGGANTGTAPRYWIEPSAVSTPIDHDIVGSPILNAADQPLSPPVTVMMPHETLVVEVYRRASSFIDVWNSLRPYHGTVNHATYFGAPRGCLLCQPSRVEQAGGGLFKVQIRLEYAAPKIITRASLLTPATSGEYRLVEASSPVEGWAELRANRGTRQKLSTTGNTNARYGAIYINDRETTSPVELNSNGTPLAANALPFQIVIYRYPYTNFSGLNIG